MQPFKPHNINNRTLHNFSQTWKRCLRWCWNIMHLSILSPGGGGRARGGDFDIFYKKMSNSPPPGQNNWSKSPWKVVRCLFKPSYMTKIPTLGPSRTIKIPTLGTYLTIKFPWLARPPPPSGLTLIGALFFIIHHLMFASSRFLKYQFL